MIGSRVQEFQTLAGPILGPEPAAIAPVALPYLVTISLYFFFVVRRGQRPTSWHQRLPHDLGM